MADKVRQLTQQDIDYDHGWTAENMIRARRIWNGLQVYKRAANQKIEWLY